MDVVREIVDLRKQEGYPHPDEEQLELKRMGEEADEWIKLAELLLKDLETKAGKEIQGQENTEFETKTKGEKSLEKEQFSSSSSSSSLEEKSSKGSERKKSETSQELPDRLPEEMSVIGVDDNIHSKSLQQAIEEVSIHVSTCM